MSEARSVLLIDDEPQLRMLLSGLLEDSGFVVSAANDGLSGFEAFLASRPDAVLLDLQMPGMDGHEVLRRVVAENPDVPVIVVSGTGDRNDVIDVMREGAWDFVPKPVGDPGVLLAALDRGLARARLRRENRDRQEELEREVRVRTRELRDSNKQLQAMLAETVRTLGKITEMRDPYTSGHQAGVARIAAAIARELDLAEVDVEAVRIAGELHDIGKMRVPAEILVKPSRLEEREMNIVRLHPQAGFEILADVPFPRDVARFVLQHHERLDGSGYPAGLVGEDILLQARILAVADTLEAMSSHRPYRPALGLEKAFAEVQALSGTKYCPLCVEAAYRVLEKHPGTFRSGD